jgi:hypothetical protein
LYATTKEFLIRFGLNDLNDLPKVEDMAEALGLEAPILIERAPKEMLPSRSRMTTGRRSGGSVHPHWTQRKHGHKVETVGFPCVLCTAPCPLVLIRAALSRRLRPRPDPARIRSSASSPGSVMPRVWMAHCGRSRRTCSAPGGSGPRSVLASVAPVASLHRQERDFGGAYAGRRSSSRAAGDPHRARHQDPRFNTAAPWLDASGAQPGHRRSSAVSALPIRSRAVRPGRRTPTPRSRSRTVGRRCGSDRVVT